VTDPLFGVMLFNLVCFYDGGITELFICVRLLVIFWIDVFLFIVIVVVHLFVSIYCYS
jgi:hypothetical protein